MVTEHFLNSCYLLIFSKRIKLGKDVIRDILFVVSHFIKSENKDIPITIKNKIECLKVICELKLEGKDNSTTIDSISVSEKFKPLLEFIESKEEEEINDEIVESTINQVRLRKKFCLYIPNTDKLLEFLDQSKDGSYNSIDDFIENYRLTIKDVYSSLMQTERIEDVENYASLDLVHDNYEPAVELIKSKYDRKNTVPTGIPIFDEEIFNGGFAKSRLYILGGGSGSGKSTLLMNNFSCQITGKRLDGLDIIYPTEKNDKEVYLFITCENQIDETLLRMYQFLYGKTEIGALRDMVDGSYVKKQITSKVRKNVIPIIKYFPKFSIGILDIISILNDAINQYGKNSIKCLYVDYLDLLKGETRYDAYRLELGFIASGLKDIAVEYNIPVITASQLNKSIYNQEDSKSFNLGMMSESMKKVDHADFIAMMLKDKNENIVHLRIGKNRSGVSEVSIVFTVDFKTFRFIKGSKVQVNKPEDSVPVDKNHKFTGAMNSF